MQATVPAEYFTKSRRVTAPDIVGSLLAITVSFVRFSANYQQGSTHVMTIKKAPSAYNRRGFKIDNLSTVTR